MRIKTFIARTLPEAMAQVRQEMGEAAVILAVEEARPGKSVSVRAALERPREMMAEGAAREACAGESAGWILVESQIEENLRMALRGDAQKIVQARQWRGDVDLAPALGAHRLPADVQARILALAGESGRPTPESALSFAFERIFAFLPAPVLPARPLLLLGAYGHGKSTAAARLAVRAVTAGGRIAFCTMDAGKAGALSQIESYAQLLKGHALTAGDASELAGVSAAWRARATLIIDTPGLSMHQPDALRAMEDCIAAADAEPIAVISAETDPFILHEFAQSLAALGAKRAILTRLDMTGSSLAAVAACASAGLAIAHFSASPFLADGLEAAHPMLLARKVLARTRDRAFPQIHTAPLMKARA